MKHKSLWVAVIVATLLALIALPVVMGGCGGTTTTTAAGTTTTAAASTTTAPATTGTTAAKKIRVGTQFSITNPPKAGGWDRADWVGIEYMRNELGWEVSVAEGVPYPQAAATAAGFAEKGYDIVVFPDNGQIEAFKSVPAQYPDTWFVMTSGTDALPEGSDKVAAWVPNFYVYGNMVGAVAALASKSGIIGVSGGVPIPVLIEMYSGIIEGAKAVKPDVKVIVSWVGDWVDLPKHKEVTNLQIQQGADVIFTVTGLGTTGVFEAAEQGGAKCIGYAADWYDDAPKAVMTSVLIDKAQMYKDLADKFMNGTLKKEIYPCGAEFFKVADFRGSLDADTVAKINDVVKKLQSGELKIPVVQHPEIEKQ